MLSLQNIIICGVWNPASVNRLLIQVEEIGALSYTIKRRIEKVLRKNSRIKKLIEENYDVNKDE